jgi:hypothetical protein
MTETRALDVARDILAGLDDDDAVTWAVLQVLTEPDVAAAALNESVIVERMSGASPHAVSQANVFEDYPAVREKGKPGDADYRPPGSAGRVYTGMDSCPDCGQGLTSLGNDVFACVTLARYGDVRVSKGDVIACGRTRE